MRSSLDEFLDITKEYKVIGDYIGTITWGRGKNPNIVVYYEGNPKHNKNEFWDTMRSLMMFGIDAIVEYQGFCYYLPDKAQRIQITQLVSQKPTVKEVIE